MTRIVVAACSEVGARCTRFLLERGETIALLYTHPERPGEERFWEPIPVLARAFSVPCREVEDLDGEEERRRIADAAPDFLLSFYFRRLIPTPVLALAARGALNMHGSLLPRFRGRAPVNWAILKGARETGASLHYMTEKPDAGDLVDQEAVPIGPDDDALAVTRRVAEAAVRVLERSWPRLVAGTAERRPQDLSKGSYFGRRRPEDGRIDWTRPAREVHDLVRAVAPPWPGAFTDLFGETVFVLKTRLAPDEDRRDQSPEGETPPFGVRAGDGRTVFILAARLTSGRHLDALAFRAWALARGAGRDAIR